MYGAICLDSDSANVKKLYQQVFKLMNDLSFIGNKKELIKRLGCVCSDGTRFRTEFEQRSKEILKGF